MDRPLWWPTWGLVLVRLPIRWFDDMYEGAKELGVSFTAIGLVTPDPATVDSVVKWADALQDRTDYLIVKNSVN